VIEVGLEWRRMGYRIRNLALATCANDLRERETVSVNLGETQGLGEAEAELEPEPAPEPHTRSDCKVYNR
jgi:hypothetical protein